MHTGPIASAGAAIEVLHSAGPSCHAVDMWRANAMLMVMGLSILGTSGCKRDEEVVAPVDDTWVPDETQEPVAVVAPDPAPEMSEEEKLEQAKVYFGQAEEKAAAEDWAAAVGLYEQAYYLVPGKHGFALKVGLAADKAGDCAKAITYFEHFVTYAEGDKYKDDLAKTKKRLGELKKKGC